MSGVSERDRRILDLLDLTTLPVSEIASRLGLPTRTVNNVSQRHRGGTARIVVDSNGMSRTFNISKPRQKRAREHQPVVYWLWDDDDNLLYVGKSIDHLYRWSQHAADQPWWSDVARFEIVRYATTEEMDAAERAAIIDGEPIHNRVLYA